MVLNIYELIETRKMRKIFVIMTLVFCASFAVNAQSYDRAIGLRLGAGNGITYKQSFGRDYVELVATFRYQGLNLTGLYEWQNAIRAIDGLSWYYGAGAHVGFMNYNRVDDKYDYTGFGLGVDGVIGLEYIIPVAPLTVSLDWKPGIQIIGYAGYWQDFGSLSVRYTF